MRIALGAVLSFAALWFVALRPKPITDVPVDPVPVERSTPAKKATKKPAAKKATAKAAAAKARTKADGTGATAVLADLEAGRTVVLLFWDGKSAEDFTVRRAVDRVDTRGGKVRIRVANLRQIAKYGAITAGVPVTSSPTVLIIGKDRKAESITGLTVPGEINDAVTGVMRAPKQP